MIDPAPTPQPVPPPHGKSSTEELGNAIPAGKSAKKRCTQLERKKTCPKKKSRGAPAWVPHPSPQASAGLELVQVDRHRHLRQDRVCQVHLPVKSGFTGCLT